ncbi:MAG TPA: hypothetical protein VFG69_08915 [Nannocystaceae bacterium]|nr:hypothetical protein [Nannocystaceae bacterium]
MDLPELAPPERALLQRFRADESPGAGAIRRVEARLAARLQSGDADVETEPLARVLPFAQLGKAAVIACALAAAVLLVLGGSARLVHAVRDGASPTQASDVNATAPDGGQAHDAAPAPASERSPAVVPESAVVVPPPPSTPIDLAAVPGALDAPRRDASPKPAPRPDPVVTPTPAPADAAAEIALLSAVKRERDPERRLAKVREYGQTFPDGALAIEIAVLEIESLCALGRTERATEKSAAFLRKHPDSAYAAIARRGCSREGGRR